MSTETKTSKWYCYALDFTRLPRSASVHLLLPIEEKFTWTELAHISRFPALATIQIGKTNINVELDGGRPVPLVVPMMIDHQAISVTIRNKKPHWFRSNRGQIVFAGTIEVEEAV